MIQASNRTEWKYWGHYCAFRERVCLSQWLSSAHTWVPGIVGQVCLVGHLCWTSIMNKCALLLDWATVRAVWRRICRKEVWHWRQSGACAQQQSFSYLNPLSEPGAKTFKNIVLDLIGRPFWPLTHVPPSFECVSDTGSNGFNCWDIFP